jgi:hypothetical protein
MARALLKLGNEVAGYVGAIGQLLLRQPAKTPQSPKLRADRLAEVA